MPAPAQGSRRKWLWALVPGLVLGLGLAVWAPHRPAPKAAGAPPPAVERLFDTGGPDYIDCRDIQKLGYEPLRVQRGGQVVRLLWRRGKAAKATVLFFHGNGGTLCFRAYHAEKLKDERWNVALVEYPGFGRDTVAASETMMLANSLAAYDVVRAQGGGLPVVAFGEALGTGPATYLASQRGLAGLILQAPYPSLKPLPGEIQRPLAAEAWAPQVHCKVLAFLGELDQQVPLAQGQEQARHFKDAEVIVVPGADQVSLPWKDVGLFWGKVLGFIAKAK